MKKNHKKGVKSKFPRIFVFIYIPILIITFFQVYKIAFNEKVSYAGDNAAYYILGKSLVSGEGYANIYSKQKSLHNHFPVGYPLIIASTMKLFSEKIDTIKKMNGFFLLMSIIVLFFIFYEFTDNYHIPFIVCFYMLFNYHLLYYSSIMMSEIPFLFFSSVTFYLFIKTDFSLPLKKNWMFISLIIILSFSFHIRTMGISLLVALIVYLAIKRNWKYFIASVSGFVLLGLPWYLRSKSLGGSSYAKSLLLKNPYRVELGPMTIEDFFQRLWDNFERYLAREVPTGVFNLLDFYGAKEQNPILTEEWILGLFAAVIIVIGIYKVKKYFLHFLLYLVAVFGILLIWPSQWFGVRFMLPILPLLFFLFLEGLIAILTYILGKILKIKEQSIIIGVLIVSLFMITSYKDKALTTLSTNAKAPYVPKFKNYFDLAVWVNKNSSDSSLTVCRKGELFYLYSGKYVSPYLNTLIPEEQIDYLKEINADYVVLDQLGYSSTQRYLYPAIKRYPVKFKVVKHLKNPDTYLMEFHPELGYFGGFKDSLRDGIGEFVWEDGKRFKGEWKNNLRNGKGILTYLSGDYLEGVWTNDSIDGEAKLWSKEGEIRQSAIYKKNRLISNRKFEQSPKKE